MFQPGPDAREAFTTNAGALEDLEKQKKAQEAAKAAEILEAQRLADEAEAKATEAGENPLEDVSNEEVEGVFANMETTEETPKSE